MALEKKKKIVLIAHDNRKDDLLKWSQFNKGSLSKHELFGSGSTGKLIREKAGLDVKTFKSGPLGGDLQVGAAVAERRINFLIFFWDPLEPLPHDPDIKALLRIAVLYNIPIASNRATADFLISSPLMDSVYENETPESDAETIIEKNKK
jgi:methylglyoxal synthase